METAIGFKKQKPLLISLFIGFIALNSLKATFLVIKLSDVSDGYLTLGVYKFTIILPVLLMVYFLLIKPKKPYLLLLFYIIQGLYLFANIAYYGYFYSYLDITSIFLLPEALRATRTLAIIIDWSYLLLLIDLPLFIFVYAKYKGINRMFRRSKKILVIFLMIILFFLFFYEFIAFLGNHSFFQKGYFDRRFEENFIEEQTAVRQYGLVTNNIIKVFILGKKEKEIIENIDYGRVNKFNGTAKNNIIVIQVESFDSSIINRMYKGKPVTPYLNKLSENSLYYPYVLSYHGKGATTDSEFSVINSIEPISEFMTIRFKTYRYPNSYLKEFVKNDYSVYSFHGNFGVYFNRRYWHKQLGFQKHFDIKEMRLRKIGWGAKDEDVFKFVLDEAHKQEGNFYYHIITMNSHAPFDYINTFYSNPSFGDITDRNVKNYFNSMSYVDAEIEEFVESTKDINNTYIFIYGDHTANLREGAYNSTVLRYGGQKFEFVPLLIITPDDLRYTEDDKVASFMDIGLTVISASGINATIFSDGTNLLDIPLKDGKVYMNKKEYSREELFDVMKNEV